MEGLDDLLRAATPADVAAAIAGTALSRGFVEAASVWAVTHEGTHLENVLELERDRSPSRSMALIALHSDNPLAAAVRGGAQRWTPGPGPDMTGLLPLGAGSQVRGCLLVRAKPVVREKTGGDLERLALIGALALDRATLRGRLQEQAAQHAVVAYVSREIDGAFDETAMLEGVARALASSFADACLVDLIFGDGHRRVATAAPSTPEPMTERLAKMPVLECTRAALAQQRPVVAQITPSAVIGRSRLSIEPHLSRDFAVHSVLAVPLVSGRDHVLGAMTFLRMDVTQPFERLDESIGHDVGRRIARSIDRIRTRRAMPTPRYGTPTLPPPAGAPPPERWWMSSVVPDLRRQVQLVVLEADGLRARSVDERTRNAGMRIRSASSRMARVLRQLVDSLALESGESIALDPRDVDVAVETTRIAEACGAGRAIEVLAHGETAIVVDPDRFEQIVEELVFNALDHGDEDLPISVEVEGRSPLELVVCVQNGGAIPREQLASLFERRAQAAPGMSRRGSGVGLFIVNRLAQRLGGTLSCTSTPELGTTFKLVLPRQPPEEIG